MLVTGIFQAWSEEGGFSLELRGLTGTDLQWTSFETFPWGQSVSLTAEASATFRTPWQIGFGLGGGTSVSTPGYTGTSLIYRSTIQAEGFILGFWDLPVIADMFFRLGAGPSAGTMLFHKEKSFTYGLGFRLDPQWTFRDGVSGSILVLGLPFTVRNLLDASRQVSLGFRVGFRLAGGLKL